MLSELVKISNYYGNNIDFVLAGGGNSSCKDKDFLYIKASGESLDTIKEDGFVKMSCPKLSRMLTKQYPIDDEQREAAVLVDLMDARAGANTQKRPSVETLLHYLLPQTFVVHTHPALVNGILCVKGSREIIKELFGNETIWLNSMMPGYMLSKTVETEIKNYKSKYGKNPQMIFLENHGVFVATDTIEDIEQIYDNIVNKISARIKTLPDLSPVEYKKQAALEVKSLLLENGCNVVEHMINGEIKKLTADKTAFLPVLSVYTPDHMVYCGADAIFADSKEDLAKVLETLKVNQKPISRLIAVKGLGVFACGNNPKSARTTAMLFIDTVKIAMYTKSFGQYQFLSSEMIDFIGNWEVEKYRSSVSLGSDAKIKCL